MAVAVSVPKVQSHSTSQTHAAKWTAISAAVALLATVPLVWILTRPLSQLMFTRGSEHDGSWSYVFMIALILTAPATYALFFGTAGELLKARVTAQVHRTTMRVAAMGMLPYVVIAIAAVYWESGPQLPLLVTAGLTIPIAMVATIWTAGHQRSTGELS